MVLLTPLAQGADQLTAGVALDVGIAVHAVLPMNIDEYRRDFTSDSALQEFEYYVGQSSSLIELPATDTAAGRSACYAEAGKWIVDECDMLIALWDGGLQVIDFGRARSDDAVATHMTTSPDSLPYAVA